MHPSSLSISLYPLAFTRPLARHLIAASDCRNTTETTDTGVAGADFCKERYTFCTKVAILDYLNSPDYSASFFYQLNPAETTAAGDNPFLYYQDDAEIDPRAAGGKHVCRHVRDGVHTLGLLGYQNNTR